MNVYAQTMHVKDGSAVTNPHYLVTRSDVAKFDHDNEMLWYKEFSPPLSLPFGMTECEAVIAQAETEPCDEFVLAQPQGVPQGQEDERG